MAFSLTTNSPNPCNIITYKYVKNPRAIGKTDDVYNPNTTDVGYVRTDLIFIPPSGNTSYIRYWYLNVMDVLGPSKIISFNRMRMKVQYDSSPSFTFTLRAILYKLTSDAKIGDATTYTNSTKVVESDTITISSNISKSEQLIDFVFPQSTNISAYDGTTENHYFIGLEIRTSSVSGSEILTINVSSICKTLITVHGSYISNFIFSGANNGSLGDTIDYVSDDGFFPYYTLWNDV